jgi:O-antigen/teichoic acid export membrane protein
MYPNINGKTKPLDEETKKEIAKNITALSMHKIGGAVVFSTDSILTSIFCGIVVLGAYSNYTLITSAIVSIFVIFINGIQGSIGNLVASQPVEYVYNRFRVVNFIYSYLASFTTICLVVLFQPFIKVWTGNEIYLLNDSTVILICLSFYLTRMRCSVGVFKDAAGLFWHNKWMPIVESGVNLIVSIIFANWFGIDGIFIGTIVSTLVAPFWVEPHILFKHYFKKSSRQYFGKYILNLIIMIMSCIATYCVCSLIPLRGVGYLIIRFIVCISVSNIILMTIYLPTKEFWETLTICKVVINSFFKRRQ